MNRITVNYEEKPCYDIVLTTDFNDLGKMFSEIDAVNRKVCIVTDSAVGPLYLEAVKKELAPFAVEIVTYTFPAGEASKKLDVVYEIYETLIKNQFDRKDILVALGGGVVGDMTGYAAATYLRGVRFMQIPTSLLSMVDSSIGGKTGVDYKAYKNMVGAFHQPKAVYMNISVLSSLTRSRYTSGMGEIVKHALIRSKEYYTWLKEHNDEILQLNPEIVLKMIHDSLMVKKAVVERDPKEMGERALLNFGHTLGHAIEKNMNFTMLHGDCVAVGAMAASYLTYQRGNITIEELEDIRDFLKGFELPVKVSGLNVEDVLATSRSDKKMDAGQIKFVLLNRIGDAYIDSTVTQEEMKSALEYVIRD